MQNEVPFLAAQYVYPETLRTFLEYVETGRAGTVEDMLNLYEQDVKHQQVLEAQKKIEQEKSINFLTFSTSPLTINLSFFIKSKTENILP